jgi:hypothetical protein
MRKLASIKQIAEVRSIPDADKAISNKFLLKSGG